MSSETMTVPLGQLHRNDYNPRFARERHGGDVNVDIESLTDSISEHGLASPLSVRENEAGYEVIAGERRLLALRECHDEDYEVPVTVHDLDREGAMQLAFEENEEREDLTPMDEAWYFAEQVTIDVDGEEMSYAKYIIELVGHVPPSNLQVPHPKTVERQGVSSDRVGVDTISERLSYLLLPDEAQEWIDEGELTKRAARMIIQKCRSNIEDPQDALDMMTDLAETYGPKFGSMRNGDYDDLRDDIKTRIKEYERRERLAKENLAEYANAVYERLADLNDDLTAYDDRFDAPYPVPPIPVNYENGDVVVAEEIDTPRDINIDGVLTGVSEYRDELEVLREGYIEEIGDAEDEVNRLESQRSQIQQALVRYDDEDGNCPFCRQPLDVDDLSMVKERKTERIDELRPKIHEHDEILDAITAVKSTLLSHERNISGMMDGYNDAYSDAMELGVTPGGEA